MYSACMGYVGKPERDRFLLTITALDNFPVEPVIHRGSIEYRGFLQRRSMRRNLKLLFLFFMFIYTCDNRQQIG